MKVNICGIPHEVIYSDDNFTADATHFGEIDYVKAKITINKSLNPEMRKQTLIHEMLHGFFVHLGYSEQSQDEQFIQCLSQAMAQSFDVKADMNIKDLAQAMRELQPFEEDEA